jgi:ribonucleotide monophosphatase NagD (HAD superfamily)
LKKLGLPAISTNPDLIVLEKHFGRKDADWVIRQGSLAQAYRQLGGEVLEFGKPYQNIYDYAFQKFNLTSSPKIAMIGDTFRTDIQGALNSGITPVWCLDYGVAKYEMEHGKTLEQQAGGTLDGIYLIRHL